MLLLKFQFDSPQIIHSLQHKFHETQLGWLPFICLETCRPAQFWEEGSGVSSMLRQDNPQKGIINFVMGYHDGKATLPDLINDPYHSQFIV